MNDGTEATFQVLGLGMDGTWTDFVQPCCKEELDVDVELLNWEDCAQNLVSRASCLYELLRSRVAQVFRDFGWCEQG